MMLIWMLSLTKAFRDRLARVFSNTSKEKAGKDNMFAMVDLSAQQPPPTHVSSSKGSNKERDSQNNSNKFVVVGSNHSSSSQSSAFSPSSLLGADPAQAQQQQYAPALDTYSPRAVDQGESNFLTGSDSLFKRRKLSNDSMGMGMSDNLMDGSRSDNGNPAF